MGNSYQRVVSQTDQEALNASSPNYSRNRDLGPASDNSPLQESVFHSMLTLERRRAERSSKSFVLMLLDANLESGAAARILKQATDVALTTKREIDLVGWYVENAVLGIIFTEVNLEGVSKITEILQAKIETALIKHLGPEKAARIGISLHVFPEFLDKNHSAGMTDSKQASVHGRKGSRLDMRVVFNER